MAFFRTCNFLSFRPPSSVPFRRPPYQPLFCTPPPASPVACPRPPRPHESVLRRSIRRIPPKARVFVFLLLLLLLPWCPGRRRVAYGVCGGVFGSGGFGDTFSSNLRRSSPPRERVRVPVRGVGFCWCSVHGVSCIFGALVAGAPLPFRGMASCQNSAFAMPLGWGILPELYQNSALASSSLGSSCESSASAWPRGAHSPEG